MFKPSGQTPLHSIYSRQDYLHTTFLPEIVLILVVRRHANLFFSPCCIESES